MVSLLPLRSAAKGLARACVATLAVLAGSIVVSALAVAGPQDGSEQEETPDPAPVETPREGEVDPGAQEEKRTNEGEAPEQEGGEQDAGEAGTTPAQEGATDPQAGEAKGSDAPADTSTGAPDPNAPPLTLESAGGSKLGPRYRFLDDRDALLSAWIGSGNAEAIVLDRSAGGRELFAVQFGGPGPVRLADRMTVLLLGGLDGVSLAGSEGVISVTESLLATPDALPPDVTFIAIPWANPDGLDRLRTRGCTDGRNDRPIDDDGDGLVDEDAPDDLDGDQLVLEMLIADPTGPWAREDDGRFLRPAREGDAVRYRRLREGRDDDGDGRFNEDQIGGVVLDRNFPVNWRGPWTGALSGPRPLSEPGSAAIAQLGRERRVAAVLAFQGSHGRIATPGGLPQGPGVRGLPIGADRPAFAALASWFASATGRPGADAPHTLYETYGEERSGSAIDWFYAALGAIALEIGVWGPDLDRRETGALEGAFDRSDYDTTAASYLLQDARAIARDWDERWGRWANNYDGGLGFALWHPFDLGVAAANGSTGAGGTSGAGGGANGGSAGATVQALIGGWKPFTCVNPPVELLRDACAGLDAFVLRTARALPRLAIDVVEKARDGRVALVRARIRNLGTLPSGVGPGARDGGSDLRVSVELPDGVRLVAGQAAAGLDALAGAGSSDTFEWLLISSEETKVRIVVESRWAPPVKREVQL